MSPAIAQDVDMILRFVIVDKNWPRHFISWESGRYSHSSTLLWMMVETRISEEKSGDNRAARIS